MKKYNVGESKERDNSIIMLNNIIENTMDDSKVRYHPLCLMSKLFIKIVSIESLHYKR